MNIKPCKPYQAKTVRRSLIRMPDGVSVFKVYFFSLLGRDETARYEWAQSAVTPDQFETLFSALPLEGVGFVTAFPHITKMFRFAPSAETVMHVRAFQTHDVSPLSLEREDGYLEFACYAEAVVAADEYRFWAEAASVKAYVAMLSEFVNGAVVNPAKLAAYVRGNTPVLAP